ncbi:type I-E CRISPR-associated protein Cas5/CasD [Lipingzhangella sp. LS1_29]|uniref:Type I-E CRISPR-associated protein Cas5/CasD n=1 Tax=Lipingzhangella rawalii TaxID=2055835 RepID=A0ABU2H3B3_9ACTN|nr:type I-E CRISPR-associated protein Cas5/CasD [Lipingzhangella rawalii]MDS1269791.1 type I-E CRISPR-associated protein Cas5/CasD [Lipingzhangella rawalii]
MSGFLLRLAGPLQSWGEHSAYGVRDTLAFPSRSALIGMFAAAQGLERGADLSRYTPLRFTVRIDQPGTQLVDFHTAGGGMPASRTVPTAEGKRKGAEVATIVTERSYLSGAVFTVAVTAPVDLGAEITGALCRPHWQPYLGRRSHVPDPPLLLRHQVDDPVAELRSRVPLPVSRRPRDPTATSVSVDVVHEGEPEATNMPDGQRARHTLNDIPRSFDSQRRSYAARAVTVLPERLPAELCTWQNHQKYLDQLYNYAAEGTWPSG